MSAGEEEPPARLAVRLFVDPARRRALVARVAAAGHTVVAEGGDVLLAEAPEGAPHESDPPALALGGAAGEGWAGELPADASPRLLDAGLRAVAAGLVVRAPAPAGFGPVEEITAPLTRRELEILARVGDGLSNKAIARQLGISAHTVKFHLEAVFDKLGVASRAEAVAKGFRGGIIEL